MKNIAFLFLTGLFTMFHACTYSDSDFFYVDPVPGDPPEIWITTNLDSIVNPTVTDSLEVSWEVEVINSDFYQLEAYIEEQMVFNTDTSNGTFWVTPAWVTDPGVDTLYLYFFFGTNSNSLADLVNLEYDWVTLKYPIQFEMEEAK